MRKADFEKNVQEKMQELRFRPSDEVWKRVEAGIGEKKRRPAFVWIIAGGMLLAVIGYLVSVSPMNNYAVKKTNQPGQSIANKQIAPTLKSVGAAESLNHSLPSSEKNNLPVNDAHIAKNRVSKDSFGQNDKNSGSSRQALIQNINTSEQAPEGFSSGTIDPVRDLRHSMPSLEERQLFVRKFRQQNLSSNSNLNSSEKIPSIATEKKNKWQYGISVSTGVSNLGNRLLQHDSSGRSLYNPGSAGGTRSGPSEVKSGLSFSIGGTVHRWIGTKVNIGFGIQYQYFSNSLRIGEKIDSAIFLNQNSVSMVSVNSYYKSSGDKRYHNQYHFISLPIILNWQFDSRLSWENQAIYSRLISTNGLHFDAANGAYYKDKELFNNNQFMLATALKFGWNKNKFQVGPQLQYSFTNLFNEGNPKYLRSFGFTANMNLSKN